MIISGMVSPVTLNSDLNHHLNIIEEVPSGRLPEARGKTLVPSSCLPPFIDDVDGFAPSDEHPEMVHEIVQGDDFDGLTPPLLLPAHETLLKRDANSDLENMTR